MLAVTTYVPAVAGPIMVSLACASTLDDLWLLDAEGAAYCSEIRMVMVEDEPARP